MPINAENITTDALEAYDNMMTECVLKVENFAPLATAVWAEALKELDKRGRVRLVSGSYDDIGNALVERTR